MARRSAVMAVRARRARADNPAHDALSFREGDRRCVESIHMDCVGRDLNAVAQKKSEAGCWNPASPWDKALATVPQECKRTRVENAIGRRHQTAAVSFQDRAISLFDAGIKNP